MTKPDSRRLYEKVSQELARVVAAGDYTIGQRLPSERELAQTFSVSRPTIREAIIALELDGLVEVRMGSGVYVVAQHPRGGQSIEADIGPFELLEARRAIESEACALAASRIDDEQLADLDVLVREMRKTSERDFVLTEDADRRFHMSIAQATQNSAMVFAVQSLWEARARSPQYRLMSDKAHAAGVGPRIDEHAAIMEALRTRSPTQARQAMFDHLTRVIEALLAATEVEEFEHARARIAEKRRRYTVGSF